ncbi:hypothetical protein EL26_13635 [Tumebacillus flagellatus]|uniref:Uncharacterized protein n=2 Tax=Tumebacillus flagellatus TaxID=1157490 RepID=A0A074LQL3_9BACL|nr:hypothetical protein EL26_13635 [Tumebacillus flagellatus]
MLIVNAVGLALTILLSFNIVKSNLKLYVFNEYVAGILSITVVPFATSILIALLLFSFKLFKRVSEGFLTIMLSVPLAMFLYWIFEDQLYQYWSSLPQ